MRHRKEGEGLSPAVLSAKPVSTGSPAWLLLSTVSSSMSSLVLASSLVVVAMVVEVVEVMSSVLAYLKWDLSLSSLHYTILV